MNKVKVVPISEARPNFAALVDAVSHSQETYFVASRSKVKAVLIGVEKYNALLEQLEDLEDSLDVLKAMLANEPTKPLDEVTRELEAERWGDVQRRA
ncbi:MAG: type II toxin-antitoxin system Phd/YefM family antitoxin [Chloroflexi bacterium]|nr:type II toxin-antitoxin system Phd/YefM family antitoxin [Chloroflexota bacterium]MBI4505099.1 type II toxin-antitoxin system Phd/YefM family antitoxin [Chloroflexota bacterium]